jgi:hypothetical protein
VVAAVAAAASVAVGMGVGMGIGVGVEWAGPAHLTEEALLLVRKAR